MPRQFRKKPPAREGQPSAKDLEWVAYYWRERPARMSEEMTIKARGAWFDPDQLPLARLDAFIRAKSPVAWAIIHRSAKASLKQDVLPL